jgi:hypothetical protein
MTIEEVARENGLVSPSHCEPLYISRGQILVPEFTLRAHFIKDGQLIVVHQPEEVFIPPFSSWETETSEAIEWIEAAKQADQDFAKWETRTGLPLVLHELLEMTEENEKEERMETQSPATVIPIRKSISESPLPRLRGAMDQGRFSLGLPLCHLP